jgi:hypothetical protein
VGYRCDVFNKMVSTISSNRCFFRVLGVIKSEGFFIIALFPMDIPKTEHFYFSAAEKTVETVRMVFMVSFTHD